MAWESAEKSPQVSGICVGRVLVKEINFLLFTSYLF